MQQSIKVKKRGGNIEDWNSEKVINSVVKAGISVHDAENVVIFLEAWARIHGIGGVVNSNEVRDRIIEMLKNIDETASFTYAGFKK